MEQASVPYGEQEEEDQPQENPPLYNEMNPIGEDDEIEYMKQMQEEEEQR